jgi:hypothetical protein
MIRTFRGQEIPAHWEIKVGENQELHEWQKVGNAFIESICDLIKTTDRRLVPDLLVWSQGQIISMSQQRFDRGPNNNH